MGWQSMGWDEMGAVRYGAEWGIKAMWNEPTNQASKQATNQPANERRTTNEEQRATTASDGCNLKRSKGVYEGSLAMAMAMSMAVALAVATRGPGKWLW